MRRNQIKPKVAGTQKEVDHADGEKIECELRKTQPQNFDLAHLQISQICWLWNK